MPECWDRVPCALRICNFISAHIILNKINMNLHTRERLNSHYVYQSFHLIISKEFMKFVQFDVVVLVVRKRRITPELK